VETLIGAINSSNDLVLIVKFVFPQFAGM